MAIGEHAARKRLATAEGTRRGHGMLGRLRNAIARALFAEPEPPERARRARSTSLAVLDDPLRRPVVVRTRREPQVLDEEAVMAVQRERALRRVAVAANEACDDWSRGLDLDDAMLRLRAELQTAAEFDV